MLEPRPVQAALKDFSWFTATPCGSRHDIVLADVLLVWVHERLWLAEAK